MTDQTPRLNLGAAFRVPIGVTLLVVGVLLSLSSLWFLYRIAPESPLFQRSVNWIFLSITISFAVVLMPVGWRSIFLDSAAQELMPVVSWRRLAGLLFVIAVVFGVLFHWGCILVPAVIGAACLVKDPRVAEKLQWLALWP